MTKGEIMKAPCLIATTAFLLSASCQSGTASSPPPAKDMRQSVEAKEAFAIDLPKECNLTGGDAELDFAILRVTCKNVPLIGIYAGNAANIDNNNEGLIAKPNIGKRSRIVVASDQTQTIRGFLWQTDYSWPSELHI